MYSGEITPYWERSMYKIKKQSDVQWGDNSVLGENYV